MCWDFRNMFDVYLFRARYLLRTCDERVVEKCYDDIINSYKCKKDIVSVLVKSSSPEQIKVIIEIMKQAQIKEFEANNRINNDNNDDAAPFDKCYFDYLSQSSIFSILEYLDREDIINFKATSAFNSMIAFDIMSRYRVGRFDMNELIETDYRFGLNLKLNDKLKINRIKGNTKNKALIHGYSTRYKIDPKNMLILKSLISQMIFVPTIVRDMQDFREMKCERNQAFFMIDKTKVITLDNTKELQLMSSIDHIEQKKDYKMTILQYFDLQRQTIHNIQFLYLDQATTLQRIVEYITNDLLSQITKLYPQLSCEWCTKLLYTLNMMKQYETNNPIKDANDDNKEELSADDQDNDNPFSLFVFHVPEDMDDHGLLQLFVPYGAMRCNIMRHDTGRSRGFGFVHFNTRHEAQIAIDMLNGHQIGRKRLRVSFKRREFNIPVRHKLLNIYYNTSLSPSSGWWQQEEFIHYYANYQADPNSDFRVICFELNTIHPYFLYNPPKIKSSDPVQFEVGKFYKDQKAKRKIDIPCIHDLKLLKTQIKHFENCDDNKDGDSLSDTLLSTNMDLLVTPSSTISMVREKISKKLNHVIEPKYIQIYKYKLERVKGIWGVGTDEQLKIQSIISEEEEQFVDHTARNNQWGGWGQIPQANANSFKWSIVPYDTMNVDKQYRIFEVCIYEEKIDDYSVFKFPWKSEAEELFVEFDRSANDEKLTMEEKKINQDFEEMVGRNSFCAKDFITNMIERMGLEMYGEKYKSIIDKYNDKEKYSFVIMDDKSLESKDFKCYEGNDDGNDTYWYEKKNGKTIFYGINVLIVPIVNQKRGDFEYPVIVRFDKDKPFTFGESASFPKKIFISKQCTTKNIVDKCLNGTKHKFKSSSCLIGSDDKINDENESIYDKIINAKHKGIKQASDKIMIVGDMEKNIKQSDKKTNTKFTWKFETSFT